MKDRIAAVAVAVAATWGMLSSFPELAAQGLDSQPTDAAVRDSVARSLPFLEKAGMAWMDERGCLSCHHVPFLLWSHRAAQAQGLTVDAGKLAEWDEWARKDSLAHRNSFKLPKAEAKRCQEPFFCIGR